MTGKLPEVDPFKIYPLDPVSEEYVDRVLRAVPGYNEGTLYHYIHHRMFMWCHGYMKSNLISFQSFFEGAQVRLDFADSLIRFAPENSLEHLQDIPLLVVHGEINELHPVAEPISLLAKYPGTIYFKKSLIFPNTQMWICYEIQDKLMYTGCHKVVTQSGCWTIMKNFRMSFEMSMYGPRASRIAKDTQFF